MEGAKKQQLLPVMVMAEAPKVVQAKGVAPPVESAVQAVEKVKAPQPEPEAQEEEEEQQKEYDVEEFLAQHQVLVDGMLAEVMLERVFGRSILSAVDVARREHPGFCGGSGDFVF